MPFIYQPYHLHQEAGWGDNRKISVLSEDNLFLSSNTIRHNLMNYKQSFQVGKAELLQTRMK